MKSAEKKDMILEVIVRYIQLHGYPPTFREIGEIVQIRSLSQVSRYIRQMVDDGELQTDANGSARALGVPGYRFEKAEEISMARKGFTLTRSQYKEIKKMDHQQMQNWVQNLIQRAYGKGKEAAEGLGETDMKKVLLSVKGIGEKKAEAILSAICDAVKEKEGNS